MLKQYLAGQYVDDDEDGVEIGNGDDDRDKGD